MGSFLDFFYALANYSWMQRAFYTALIVGIVGGIIGVFILLKGMVFLGQAIAHTAFAGAALAILLGIEPLYIIIVFGVIAALGVGYVNEKKIMKEDIIIGVIFTFFMALAIIFITLNKKYSTDVNAILFGNILLVSKLNFIVLLITLAIVGILILGLKKEYYLIAFNSEIATVSGVPVKLLDYLLLVLLALTIDVSLKAIGAILVFAMIVTPAAAAYQWTFKINKMLLLSSIIGVISSIGGLFLSYLLNLSSGATIVSLSTLIFLFSFLVSPKRIKTGFTTAECKFCRHVINGESYCLDEPECRALDIPHYHDDKGIIILKKDIRPLSTLTRHKHDKKEER
ncbi:MAG: metal ABC transporter permease [Candidatus Heimdallarchaeaceae archaeon]